MNSSPVDFADNADLFKYFLQNLRNPWETNPICVTCAFVTFPTFISKPRENENSHRINRGFLFFFLCECSNSNLDR
jgi:hypothetical protein